ncbi:MAG TPA: DsrE/DsrF/DrsH-like family protein, partial [Candidatus Brocadiia bacterium]|nr:DsrE/DsrF/DrsH-like family protein [Candidatus Brocadiia bacterium]
VDSHMRTSDPAIFAVGDAVETPDLVTGAKAVIPLAGPANRQGRIAADNALGRDSEYRSTQGTAIVRVFDVALAMTGASEKALKRAGVAYQKCYVHPMQHASYYPGASPITLKLLFSAPEGRILGACAVGVDGVDKRIDVIATAQRAGLTVHDLEHLELCYSPQFGSAKDPVNMAGFVAANMLRGDAPTIHVPELDELDREKIVLLDVRKPDENQAGSIPGSVLIPLDELRKRRGELPKDKKIVTYCQVGLRGYIAARQLMQSGFDVSNLSGGYKTYCQFHPAPAGPCAKPAPVLAAAKGGAVSEENPDGAKPAPVAAEVDARGLQCPGPIQRIKEAVDRIGQGQTLRVIASDPAFLADLPAWCSATGNHLVSMEAKDGAFVGVVRKPTAAERVEALAASPAAGAASKNMTIVVFSGDLDRALAAFVIANGSVAMGGRVTMFFTFWGLNALRRDQPVEVDKSMMDRMFGWMMPRGARKLKLSKMNMAGLGTRMMRAVMSKKNVPSLPEMIESARKSGVKLVACSMSMDVMGLKREELLEGVDVGGVATYLAEASKGGVNLFI